MIIRVRIANITASTMQKSLLVVVAIFLLLSGEAIAKKHHGKHKGSKSHSGSHSHSKGHSHSSDEGHGPNALVTKAKYYVYLTELNYRKIQDAVQYVITIISRYDGQQQLTDGQRNCVATVIKSFYDEIREHVRREYVELYNEAWNIKQLLQGERCDKYCEMKLRSYVDWDVPASIERSLNNIELHLIESGKIYQTEVKSCF